MQIHIVQPNQTLTTIAAQYSVSVPSITEANELPNPDQPSRRAGACYSNCRKLLLGTARR